MKLSITAAADYDIADDTFLLLMVEPALEGETHVVHQESLRTTPTPFSQLDRDLYGNTIRRLMAPKGFFTFDFLTTISVDVNVDVPEEAEEVAPFQLPPETLIYTLPSRYCQSDRLTRLARGEFSSVPPGGARISAVKNWIQTHVEYRYGTTDAMTSAYDTVTQRVGVCRDFAHLTIAFCRALGVPSRYVSGYCLGLEPPDFHGYAQVYLSGGWYNVDSTFAGTRPALVPIAFGRDAADVAMLTLWGSGVCREQSVQVRRIDET